MELLTTVASLAFAAGFTLRGILDGDDSPDDHVEQYLENRREKLQERYETTTMDYVEFEECITVLELPGTKRIMRDAVRVDGIGVEIAYEIARTFDGDYQAYRNAERSELEKVNQVGENRATSLMNS